MITSCHNKLEDISDDAQKFQKDVDNKTTDAHAALSTRINKVNENIEQLTIDNTAELFNHAEHMDSQQEALNEETKIFVGDTRDDIKIVQLVHAKNISDLQFGFLQ